MPPIPSIPNNTDINTPVSRLGGGVNYVIIIMRLALAGEKGIRYPFGANSVTIILNGELQCLHSHN